MIVFIHLHSTKVFLSLLTFVFIAINKHILCESRINEILTLKDEHGKFGHPLYKRHGKLLYHDTFLLQKAEKALKKVKNATILSSQEEKEEENAEEEQDDELDEMEKFPNTFKLYNKKDFELWEMEATKPKQEVKKTKTKPKVVIEATKSEEDLEEAASIPELKSLASRWGSKIEDIFEEKLRVIKAAPRYIAVRYYKALGNYLGVKHELKRKKKETKKEHQQETRHKYHHNEHELHKPKHLETEEESNEKANSSF